MSFYHDGQLSEEESPRFAPLAESKSLSLNEIEPFGATKNDLAGFSGDEGQDHPILGFPVLRLQSVFHPSKAKKISKLSKDSRPSTEESKVVKSITSFPKEPSSCNCLKSKCLKLYCECFTQGKVCSEKCKCKDCHNHEQMKDVRSFIQQETREKNSLAFKPKFKNYKTQNTKIHARGCQCQRTECIKSYCECFRAGAGCSRLCKCTDCKNKQVVIEDKDVPLFYEKILRRRKKQNFFFDLYFQKKEENGSIFEAKDV